MAQNLLDNLRAAGMDEATLSRVASAHLLPIKRPGVYEGCHFYDLGDTLLWATGPNGERCGEDLWYNPAKKDGDKATDLGTCPSGLDYWQIELVA